jgi:predicted small metal-binding protein
MKRHYIDCRELPNEEACTLRISADGRKELLEAAVRHVVEVHQHEDTPQLRDSLQGAFKTLREDARRHGWGLSTGSKDVDL